MPDECRVYQVDGELIRVHGGAPMDEADQAAFAELVRAAKRRYAREHPDHDEERHDGDQHQ